jgi:hypothetical protein
MAPIDDIYGGAADDVWSALDAHPAVEVRLFNLSGAVQVPSSSPGERR